MQGPGLPLVLEPGLPLVLGPDLLLILEPDLPPGLGPGLPLLAPGSERVSELSLVPRLEDSDQEFNMINDLCEVMDRTSLCQMGGMTPIPVRSAMERFPEDFVQETNA